VPCARAHTLYRADAEVLGAAVLEALVLDVQVLAVARPSGGGLE
jgi:hypothetical protein